ncbi:MAG: hypothetical protein ABSB96_11110 [Gaiellaceae bacterium]
MTNGLGRLYATALTMVVFFVAWAVIAARPWVPENEGKQDPRLVALNARELKLRQDAIAIKKIVDKRWVTYRVELARRKHLIAVRAKQNAARAQAQAVRQIQTYQQSSQSAAVPSAPVVRVAPAAPAATQTRTS